MPANTPSIAQIAVANAATSAKRTSNSAFALDDLIALRDKHDAWLNGTYKASNDELYSLLAMCLDIYERMTGKRTLISAFATECARLGLKFKKTTPLIHRIVKYIFGADSKRASRYAAVLSAAQAVPVESIRLHTWIAGEGGIEEIRAKQTGRASPAARAKLNKSKGEAAARSASTQQTYDVPNFSIKDAESPYVAVLARVNDAGVIELIAPIADERAVEAVLAAYGASVSVINAGSVQLTTVNAQNDATVAALAS